jgi:hypothetical protein
MCDSGSGTFEEVSTRQPWMVVDVESTKTRTRTISGDTTSAEFSLEHRIGVAVAWGRIPDLAEITAEYGLSGYDTISLGASGTETVTGGTIGYQFFKATKSTYTGTLFLILLEGHSVSDAIAAKWEIAPVQSLPSGAPSCVGSHEDSGDTFTRTETGSPLSYNGSYSSETSTGDTDNQTTVATASAYRTMTQLPSNWDGPDISLCDEMTIFTLPAPVEAATAPGPNQNAEAIESAMARDPKRRRGCCD